MPNVAFVVEEVRKLQPQYELIRDCLEGERTVKAKNVKYLPMPNAEDQSPENKKRYDAYVTRAVFYNVAQRTLDGLVGQIFMRDPVVEVPELLQPVVDDATGSGVSLAQLAQEAASFALPYSRCGLFVDYPDTEGPTSISDVQEGKVRPTLQVVAPWDAINHRVKSRGAKKLLSLVVFKEEYVEQDDGFETKTKTRYRVLRLVEDQYKVEIWTEKSAQKPAQEFWPTDASGTHLDEIPFTFIGVKNNDAKPHTPAFYALCAVNMAHYRNSADYEESIFVLGQPTPYFAGLTEEWVTKVMGGGVALGSRGAVMLPEGGTAGLLQAEPNTMAKEGMEQKEAQMLALGAKLVEGSQVQRTATEANNDNTSEQSVLSSVAKNTAAAVKWALEKAALFVGAKGEIEFKLNTEFDLVKMTPEERRQLISEWQAGAIAFEEMRANLRRAGVATLDDAAAKSALEKEAAEALAGAVEEAGALHEATPPHPKPADPPKGK